MPLYYKKGTALFHKNYRAKAGAGHFRGAHSGLSQMLYIYLPTCSSVLLTSVSIPEVGT